MGSQMPVRALPAMGAFCWTKAIPLVTGSTQPFLENLSWGLILDFSATAGVPDAAISRQEITVLKRQDLRLSLGYRKIGSRRFPTDVRL